MVYDIGVLANAVAEANGGKLLDFVSGNDNKDGKEIMQQALETVKRKEDRPRRFDDRRDNRDRRDHRRDNNRDFRENKMFFS